MITLKKTGMAGYKSKLVHGSVKALDKAAAARQVARVKAAAKKRRSGIKNEQPPTRKWA